MKSIGIDGCRSGWISVNSDMEIHRFDTILELTDFYGENCFYLIDIPIGLVNQTSTERACEKLMRQILQGSRKSSVFNVPCREALQAINFEDANRINRLVLGKGISKQSYFIFNKILEVDIFLRERNSKNIKLNESHPEVAFHFLNSGKSIKFNKKTKEGLAERLHVLELYDKRVIHTFDDSVKKFLRKEVAKDDIVDAMCLAITGNSLPNRVIQTLPQKIELDHCGLQMGINYSIEKN